MSRRKGSDSFGFDNYKSTKGIGTPAGVKGADSQKSLKFPQPTKYRFRPPLDTKAQSVVSNYQYASLWSRWRRGYELAMYGRQTFDAFTYSAKYFISQPPPGIPAFFAGLALFMYPSMRSDMRMHMCGVRPAGTAKTKPGPGDRTINIVDLDVTHVEQYGPDVYAVTFFNNNNPGTGLFGAPVSFFQGETLSTRFNADSTRNLTFNNYTVAAVGRRLGPNQYIQIPASPIPIFDTLFLTTGTSNSWSVLEDNRLVIPALRPPQLGDVYITETRAQCDCQDFLGRESYNFWENSIRQRYPYTDINDLTPGIYDAGGGFTPNPDIPSLPNRGQAQSPRPLPVFDDPGYVRTFGTLYLNNIYNIPEDTEASYSDPNIYYFAPRWCKHIYASYWEMKLRFNQDIVSNPWVIPEPNDELLDERYRHYFEETLTREASFRNRERNLEYWLRYSPSMNEMPNRMMQPENYNILVKTLNFGGLAGGTAAMDENAFKMFMFEQYNPFAQPNGFALRSGGIIGIGGKYADGRTTQAELGVLNGGTYANGVADIPLRLQPNFVNGGSY